MEFVIGIVIYLAIAFLAIKPVGKYQLSLPPAKSPAHCHGEANYWASRTDFKETCRAMHKRNCWRSDGDTPRTRRTEMPKVLAKSFFWPAALVMVYANAVVPESDYERDQRMAALESRTKELESRLGIEGS